MFVFNVSSNLVVSLQDSFSQIRTSPCHTVPDFGVLPGRFKSMEERGKANGQEVGMKCST